MLPFEAFADELSVPADARTLPPPSVPDPERLDAAAAKSVNKSSACRPVVDRPHTPRPGHCGVGWANWSGLATAVAQIAEEFGISLRRLPVGAPASGARPTALPILAQSVLMSMRVVGVLFVALLAASCGSPSDLPAASSPSISAPPSTALASRSPHFVVAPPNKAAQANGYPAVIDEVGLRPNESVNYLVTAQASADYQCIGSTPSGMQGSGPSKHVTGTVNVTGTFVADETGEVNQTLVLAAPAASNTTCPAGFQLSMWRFSFTMASVLDRSHQVHGALPDLTGEA